MENNHGRKRAAVLAAYLLGAALLVVLDQVSKLAARAALKDEQGARDIFVLSGALSTVIALGVSVILYQNASWFAVHILLEERCTPLLRLMAFSIPMGTLHSCVNGYYYARKKMSVPAASQLLEQCARVGVSYGMFLVLTDQGLPVTPMLAVAGLLGGELASMIFSLILLLWDYQKHGYRLFYIHRFLFL